MKRIYELYSDKDKEDSFNKSFQELSKKMNCILQAVQSHNSSFDF